MSQQQLAIALNIHPSRLVAILDELETRGLVERRGNPDDRRVYAVSLTEEGKGLLQRIAIIGREHNSALLKALKPSEREELASLLQRIADEQGLTRGVHPGFARWAGRARTRGPEER
jgi:DNA-binding MarR family transcriptional regulator